MDNHNRHYQQLTQGERYQIEVLRKGGFSLRAIGRMLDRDHSTIARELRRNTTARGYMADTADCMALRRRQSAAKAGKQDARHHRVIREGLLLGWSPENISARMRLEMGPSTALSHTTIYRLIDQDKAQGGALYKQLPRHGKTRWKGGKRKAGRSLIPNRVDITQRPKVVEPRARLGDWEGDTVYGQDAHLVTLVERQSRLLRMRRVPTKEAEVVANAVIDALKSVDVAYTLTLDNGGEFAAHGRVTEALGTEIYFAKPYASYQRGTNENTNGLIRRRWPKKTNLAEVSDEDIAMLEFQLNTTPRKVLGGLTPLEAYTGKRVALIT